MGNYNAGTCNPASLDAATATEVADLVATTPDAAAALNAAADLNVTTRTNVADTECWASTVAPATEADGTVGEVDYDDGDAAGT